MKNILFIHQAAELYGSDKTLLLFLKHLDKEKYHPVVILPSEGLLKEELEKLDIKVYVAPVLKLYRDMFRLKNLIQLFKDFRKAFQIVNQLHKEYPFDIVYSNTLAVLLGAFFSKQKKLKHIWHVHEIIVHPKFLANLFPKILNIFSGIVICNSNSTKQNLISRNIKLTDKTIVVYNGIEITEPKEIFVSKSDFGFNNNDIIITLVGRISRLKGHKLVLEAIQKKFQYQKNIKFLFVGSPVPNQEYYLEEIQNIIKENNLSKQVKILPFTKDISPVWKITDIAIMPSTEAESFGLVAAEAMLAQKPVVAANHGGLSEIVLHKETGFLFEPNNENEFSEYLQILVEDKEKREKFGITGYHRVKNKFSLEEYVKKIESVIDSLI
ncbi:MAG: glycosyltransferase family 4 protein [Flavobacteriaceae bacterium]|nr:glycosyltransferase family 4 protein [Flavobacteriaceae bacterium]